MPAAPTAHSVYLAITAMDECKMAVCTSASLWNTSTSALHDQNNSNNNKANDSKASSSSNTRFPLRTPTTLTNQHAAVGWLSEDLCSKHTDQHTLTLMEKPTQNQNPEKKDADGANYSRNQQKQVLSLFA